MKLRPYQARDVERIRQEFRHTRRVLYTLPTGGGKTVTFSDICRCVVAKGNRVYITAHRRQIVNQISDALAMFGVQHGLLLPGHRITSDRVQVGMVQTIARRLHLLPEPNMLIVDEAHHAPAGSWKKLSDEWEKARHLGVTATPERLDGKPLGDCYDSLLIGPSTRDLIDDGYLCNFDYYSPPVQADLDGLGTRMGDFKSEELEAAMDRPTVTGDAVAHYAKLVNGAPAIAFCVTIKHAQHVAASFQAAGFRSTHIDGGMDENTRARIFSDLAAGRIQVLTCAELISEGVDIPAVAAAILLRRTKSLTMYLQQVGRALRPVYADGFDRDMQCGRLSSIAASDKPRAFILDHVGNSKIHDGPAFPRNWTLDGKRDDGSLETVTCKRCFRTWERGEQRECGDDSCPLRGRAASTADGRPAPEIVDGWLELQSRDPLAWAGGIDIIRATGAEWHALLQRAGGNAECLKQIEKLRGYKRGWHLHVLRDRQKKEKERATQDELRRIGFPTF